MQEANISTKTLIQKIADFLQNFLPNISPFGTAPKIEKPDFTAHPSPLIQTETDLVWASPFLITVYVTRNYIRGSKEVIRYRCHGRGDGGRGGQLRPRKGSNRIQYKTFRISC